MARVGGDVNYMLGDIEEFRIPVPIDELGISNSELRIIDTPGFSDSRGPDYDAKLLSTLDSYLSSHDELNNSIPNVVLIFHKFSDDRFAHKDSDFIKMIRALDYFRGRIMDENNSNVIFVLSHFCSVAKSTQNNPDMKLRLFKKVIEEFSSFPTPTILTVAENKGKEQKLLMINGSYRLPNGEFYPNNLVSNMEQVSTKGGDPIGFNVLRLALEDSSVFNISYTNFHADEDPSKINYFYKILSNPEISPNKFQSEYIFNLTKKFRKEQVEKDEAHKQEIKRLTEFYESLLASNSIAQDGPERLPSIKLEPAAGLGLPQQIYEISNSSNSKCINVPYPDVPTRLVFLGNKGLQSRYEIKGYYGRDCDDTFGPLTFNFGDEINNRIPICSFYLNSTLKRNVTVSFAGEDYFSPSYIVSQLGYYFVRLTRNGAEIKSLRVVGN